MVADKKDDAGLFGWKNWTIPEHPSNRSNITPRPGVNTHFKISRWGGVVGVKIAFLYLLMKCITKISITINTGTNLNG